MNEKPLKLVNITNDLRQEMQSYADSRGVHALRQP